MSGADGDRARAEGHWVDWHRRYDDPSSSLSRRLAIVQGRVRAALDDIQPGPVRLISMCAGQGRDVIAVLDGHARAGEVSGRLVEADPVLAEHARAAVDAARLTTLEVVTGDASSTSAYDGAVPADLVLLCGIFGNVSDDDIRRTITELPRLCASGAHVIWTRHRGAPDRTPTIRGWFSDCGFEELAFDAPEPGTFGVGSNRFAGAPQPYRRGVSLFSFVGDGEGGTG